MKLVLQKDTAERIVERVLLDASKLELSHGTVSGESVAVHPVTVERESLRLRRWARQLHRTIA